MKMSRRGALLWLVCVSCLTSACPSPSNGIRAEESRVTIQEAARFAGIALPTEAEPIGAYERKGIDRLVAFAVRLPVGEVVATLEASNFQTELRPGLDVQYEPVEGVRLDDDSRIESAQDQRHIEGRALISEVAVLTEWDDQQVLNVWAYTV